MLNSKSYAFHYQDLDSTLALARQAYDLSGDYGTGRAEALNNIAFVDIARMRYDSADSILSSISDYTSNQVELLVADVQLMRLCQRRSANRRFYDCRESAMRRLRRIKEEPSVLDDHARRRVLYAESEMAIVTSTYLYYVGQTKRSSNELIKVDVEALRDDTAQYANYLYNVGAGGIITAGSRVEQCQQEFNDLLHCLLVSRKSGNAYFEANALQAIAEHLLDSADRRTIIDNNPAAMKVVNPDGWDESDLAGILAIEALEIFENYGDVYQTAGANRSVASCYMAIGNYYEALAYLNDAIADSAVTKAPDLVASIREQMSVAYSAIDDKPMSDYNRNIYLDLQEDTRQDRELESRAAMLNHTSHQLNILILSVLFAIIILVATLWLFSRLSHRRHSGDETLSLLTPLKLWSEENAVAMEKKQEELEEIEEATQACHMNIGENMKRNLEQRARVSLATSLLSLIDRIANEVRMLLTRQESDEVKAFRKNYIGELVAKIDENNQFLTRWIKLTEGKVTTKINTFPLESLFTIIAKNRGTFASKGVELDVRPTTLSVKADRILTLFMVNTLADNALKFTPEGGSVTISADVAEGDMVEVSVTDTGSGLTEEQQATIFERKINDGHGFGLLNCRGIIEKYKKTSQRFSRCVISVESKPGEGSRFFFRLPSGAARIFAGVAAFLSSSAMCHAGNSVSFSQRAAEYADSAYYSNINGTYEKTIAFADSCILWLNRHYSSLHPGSRQLLVLSSSDSPLSAPELQWFREEADVNYYVILDIRNECAVAALALHDWALYHYNNRVFTALFNQLSADNTLADYCARMRSSQTNKTVAVIVLILLFLSILPAYYMLYYRHRLYFKYCEERISRLNDRLKGEMPIAEKLRLADELCHDDLPAELHDVVVTIRQTLADASSSDDKAATDIEVATDRLHKAEYENNRLYVCNSILDNCLSTLKHETMYYPGRIRQMLSTSETNEVAEVVEYYRNVYSLLCRQALDQISTIFITVRRIPVSELLSPYPHRCDPTATTVCNKFLIRHLLDILSEQASDEAINVSVEKRDANYLAFTVSLPTLPPSLLSSLSSTTLLIRQILRDHSEATGRRGCGVWTEDAKHGTNVIFTLPS